MSINKRKFFALTAISAAMIQFGTVAHAQEDDNVDEKEYDVITVTSSRRVQALQDVPQSVIAVNPADAISAGLNDFAEIIDYAPGFSVNRSEGHRGQGSITARGVGQQGSTAVTAIYLDDVPMTSNSGFANGASLYFDGLLGNVERIELIKGPQGTLFGATAIGGAVRYITRTPELQEGRGSISADFSKTQNGGVSKQYQGFYSLPLIEDTLGLTLSGFNIDSAGYVDQVDAATGNVIREDANDSENYGYSADLFYQATDALTFRIKGIKQKTTFGVGAKVRLDGLDKKERYGELLIDDAFGSTSLEFEVISASLNYEFDDATLDITTSKVEYLSALETDFTAAFAGFIDLLAGLEPGSTTEVPGVFDSFSNKTATEIKLSSINNNKLEWTVGLYTADESTNNIQSAVSAPTSINALFAEFPSEYKEYAAFGNVTYYITPDFDIAIGMRYADTELALDFAQSGLLLGLPPGVVLRDDLETANDTVQTYSFAARYRPNEQTSFYANIGSGYRPASATLIVRDPSTGETLSQPSIEQDSLWSYEVGVKGDALDRLITYDTSLWYLDWDNFQTSLFFNGINTTGNADNGISAHGFEGSFTVHADSDFSITTSVAYAKSTLNKDDAPLFGVKGADLPGVPNWSFASVARYGFELSGGASAWVGGGVRYTAGSPSAFVDSNPTIQVFNVESDDILLVDLNAGIQWNDSITVNLYINNLLNEYAYHNFTAVATPGTGLPDVVGVPTTPRTIGASIKYSF